MDGDLVEDDEVQTERDTGSDRQPGDLDGEAVRPVDTRRMPSACSAWANSTMPVLSETEMSACILLVFT
jgi:hypothetical protein